MENRRNKIIGVGYDKVDQFQTSALRYQINHLGYGLVMAQCMYTPNFHGYLSQAQIGVHGKELLARTTQCASPEIMKCCGTGHIEPASRSPFQSSMQ